MCYLLLVAAFLTGFLHAVADASGVPSIPFVDGLWHGEIETGPNSLDFEACWASTLSDDGTAFTLMKRKDGRWHLQLANPNWHLPPSHRYAMATVVDFYPPLRLVAEAKDRTLLEIADLERISLLRLHREWSHHRYYV